MPLPPKVLARADTLKLDSSVRWRRTRPLTVTAPETERALMRKLGIKFVLGVRWGRKENGGL